MTSTGQRLIARCAEALVHLRRDGLSPACLDAIATALVWLSCESDPRAALRGLLVRHGCRRAALNQLDRHWRHAGICHGEDAMRHVQTVCGLQPREEPPDQSLLRAALAYVDHTSLRGSIAADFAPDPATLNQMYSPTARLRQTVDAAMWGPATQKAAALLRVLPAIQSDPHPQREHGPLAVAHDAMC